MEWNNDKDRVKLGCFINFLQKTRSASTNFMHMPFGISILPSSFAKNNSIIRFFWTEIDAREYGNKYSPFLSISGVVTTDLLRYPHALKSFKNWDIKDFIGGSYKTSLEEYFSQGLADKSTVESTYTYTFPKNYFLKDIANNNTMFVGRYNDEASCWTTDGLEKYDVVENERKVHFPTKELGNLSILVNRNIFFPYLNWYLRSVDKETFIFNLKCRFLK